ncbi:MAG: BlaI/MecI/CopY family transcriptional regulator [Lachnospiraceae bacterium]|nr:BlaI/MecI/CopY family transcriptional regulator [Lachnospiraceae bacterium]
MVQQVSDFELELMKAVWENGGTALYAEITSALDRKGISATKNTIISLLSRLAGKGYLETSKIGRRNKYTAIVSADEYREMQTTAFIDKIYEGNVQGLVSTLIQKNMISTEEYEKLKRYWHGNL